MQPRHSFPLHASRIAVHVLIVINILFGIGVAALLAASVVADGPVMGALGVRPGAASTGMIWAMRAIMAIGIASVPLTHVLLTRLRGIVRTVGRSDPFVAANAERLQTMAWSLLGLQLLHLLVGVAEAAASSPGQRLDLNSNLPTTPWLAVLLLFVLARVFDEGARMRGELEGTV